MSEKLPCFSVEIQPPSVQNVPGSDITATPINEYSP